MLCVDEYVAMFIKTSIRTKATGQKYKTHYLVEGYRDKKTGTTKHRYISNPGQLHEIYGRQIIVSQIHKFSYSNLTHA